MAGLVPAIHVFSVWAGSRMSAGHDAKETRSTMVMTSQFTRAEIEAGRASSLVSGSLLPRQARQSRCRRCGALKSLSPGAPMSGNQA